MLRLRRRIVRKGGDNFHTLKRDQNTSVVGEYQWCAVMLLFLSLFFVMLLFQVKTTWQGLFILNMSVGTKEKKLHFLLHLVLKMFRILPHVLESSKKVHFL